MRACVTWIAVALLAPRAAAADGTADAALAHLDRGVAAYRAADYALAQRELSIAQELAPDRANPYRWLALTHERLGDCAAALVDVERFLSHVPAGDPRIAEVTAVRDHCARGALDIASTPPGATVQIDGAPAGATPLHGLAMRPGKHVLVLEKPGFARLSHPFEMRATGTLQSMFTLSREHTPLAHRWWFWTAIGVVALGAVAITVAATRDSGDPHLPPIHCDPAGCQ